MPAFVLLAVAGDGDDFGEGLTAGLALLAGTVVVGDGDADGDGLLTWGAFEFSVVVSHPIINPSERMTVIASAPPLNLADHRFLASDT